MRDISRAQQQTTFVLAAMLQQATFAARAAVSHTINCDANFVLAQRDRLLQLPDFLQRFRLDLRSAPMAHNSIFPNLDEVREKARQEREAANAKYLSDSLASSLAFSAKKGGGEKGSGYQRGRNSKKTRKPSFNSGSGGQQGGYNQESKPSNQQKRSNSQARSQPDSFESSNKRPRQDNLKEDNQPSRRGFKKGNNRHPRGNKR